MWYYENEVTLQSLKVLAGPIDEMTSASIPTPRIPKSILRRSTFDDQHHMPCNLRLTSGPIWSRGFKAEMTSSSNLNHFSNGNVDVGNSNFRTLSPASSSVITNSATTLSSPLALPLGSKKSVCLFYCEETKELAEKIANENQRDESIELRSIQWR